MTQLSFPTFPGYLVTIFQSRNKNLDTKGQQHGWYAIVQLESPSGSMYRGPLGNAYGPDPTTAIERAKVKCDEAIEETKNPKPRPPARPFRPRSEPQQDVGEILKEKFGDLL